MPAPYPAGVRLLPNAVTVVALCAGLSSVYFALGQKFDLAVFAVGVAALCDALDGRLARLLDAASIAHERPAGERSGPRILPQVRNMIRHPTAGGHALYERFDGLVTEGWLLAHHYLVLPILHARAEPTTRFAARRRIRSARR